MYRKEEKINREAGLLEASQLPMDSGRDEILASWMRCVPGNGSPVF